MAEMDARNDFVIDEIPSPLPHEESSPIDEAIISFLPRYLTQKATQSPLRTHPEAEEFPVALLFADISGFTKLSEILGKEGPAGVEQLTKHLNSYFGGIIDVIDEYGGDVVKIAGDAIMAIWRVADIPPPTQKHDPSLSTRKRLKNISNLSVPDFRYAPIEHHYSHEGMSLAASRATKCALKCLQIHQNHKIEFQNHARPSAFVNKSEKQNIGNSSTNPNAQLKLHCALATGQAYGVYCGGVQGSWEFLLCGDQIYAEIRQTLGVSRAGEVVLTKDAWKWVTMVSSPEIEKAQVQTIDTPYPVVKLTLADTLAPVTFGPSLAPRPVSPRDGFNSIYASSINTNSDPNALPPIQRLQTYLHYLKESGTDFDRLKSYLPTLVLKSLNASQAHRLPEHRRCTILFISIVNMSFNGVHDLDSVQTPFSIIQEVTFSADGFIRQVIVDDKGFVAIVAFGLPGFSHEDDPQRGVDSAIRIQQRLFDAGYLCSIGCTTGRVYCGDVGNLIRREYAMVGDTVNTSAHLMCLKKGIICDSTTSQNSLRNIKFDVLSNVTIKGKPNPIDVYRPSLMENSTMQMNRFNSEPSLRLEKSVALRPILPNRCQTLKVCGREKEIKIFESLLAEIKEKKSERVYANPVLGSHSCKILFLFGEPGTGKSVVMAHMLQLAIQSGFQVISSSANPLDSGVSMYIWRSIFDQLLELKRILSGHDKDEVLKEFLRASIVGIPDLDEISSAVPKDIDIPNMENPSRLMEEFMGMKASSNSFDKLDSKSRFDVMRLILRHFLNLRMHKKPMLLVLEDIQWMDSLSWAFLLDAVSSCTETLIFLTGHPFHGEEVPPEYAQLSSQTSLSTVLNLGFLNRDATCEMIRDCLDVDSVPKDLENLIYERTNGNPVFINELCISLAIEKIVVVENRKCYVPAQVNFKGLALPENVEGMVIQRIDQLPGNAATVLKVASVLGTSFTFPDLQFVNPTTMDAASIRDSLSACVRHKLLLNGLKQPDLYTFRMNVIQEVAYGLLLIAQRKKVHKKYAERLMEQERNNLGPHAAKLAHHFSRAEVVDRAVEFYHMAAFQASKTTSSKEVIENLKEAMTFVEKHSGQLPTPILVKWNYMYGEALFLLGLGNETIERMLLVVSSLEFAVAGSTISIWTSVLVDMAHEFLSHFCLCSSEQQFVDSFVAEQPKVKPGIQIDHLDGTGGIVVEGAFDPESKLSRILQDPFAEILDKDRNYLLASTFERLALVSFWDGDQAKLMYFIMKMLVYAEQATIGPILIKAYGNVALISSIKGLRSATQKYIRLVDGLLNNSQTRQSIAAGIPAGLRSVGLALISLGDFNAATSYMLTGLEVAHASNDFRLQAELVTTLGYVSYVKGGVVQGISYVNKLLYISAIRGDLQCRCWANNLLAQLHLRYHYGSTRTIVRRLQDNQAYMKVLDDSVQLLDQLITHSLLAMLKYDFDIAQQTITALLDFDPVAVFITGVHNAILCFLLRELNRRTDKHQKIVKNRKRVISRNKINPNTSILGQRNMSRKGSSTPRVNSATPFSNIEELTEEVEVLDSSRIDKNYEDKISTGKLWELLHLVLDHLKLYGAAFAFARMLLLKFQAYSAWAKGKKEKARRRFISYFHCATSLNVKFDRAVSIFELRRLYPDYPATEEEKSLPSHITLIAQLGLDEISAHFESYPVIY